MSEKTDLPHLDGGAQVEDAGEPISESPTPISENPTTLAAAEFEGDVVAPVGALDPSALDSSALDPLAHDGPRVVEISPDSFPPEALAAVAAPGIPPKRPLLSAAWDLLHDVSITVLFCFFIVTFVAQPVRVQGASMQPRIEDNERILVNKFIYRFHGIERGDVVVFYYPRDPSVSYIKRVIALPGDRVEIRSGNVYVNEKSIEEPYLLPEYRDRYDMPETIVERGHYFMMGDHRSSSQDSRAFGPVPEKYIYGKASFCVWPIAKTGRVR